MRSKPWRPILALIALTFVAHLVVLANPGFYNHDEWQRSDHVETHGLIDFLDAFVVVQAGPEFGYPVRPIGFAQQGISAIWMASEPVIPHAIDVALHAAVVVLFWSLLLRLGFDRWANWAAVIFAISPLATFSVGWVGASFDRWYVLFSLLCAHGVVSVAREGVRGGPIALVLLGSSGAVLSKETAIVLPGALLVLAYSLWAARRSTCRVRAVLGSIVLSGIPILLYLFIRWPAIQATLGSRGGPYAPAMSNVPGNALLYFAQPFMLRATELGAIPQLTDWDLWSALILHGFLLLALWHWYGWRILAAYVAGYFVFLLPVLPLHAPATHYLYASGMAFAVALTLVLAPLVEASEGMRFPWLMKALAGIVVLVVFAHSLFIQEYLYSAGACQAEFLASFKPMAEEAIAGGAKRLHVTGAPDAREYIAERTLFARAPFIEGGRWPTVVGTAPAKEADVNFVMQPDCRVLRQ
jgi:hypothetical protein